MKMKINLKVKTFLIGLKEKATEAGFIVDGVFSDYDTFEEYFESVKEENDNNFYFSINSSRPYYSIDFMIVLENETVSLASSNGYEFSHMGKPKDLNSDCIQKTIMDMAICLLK